MKMDNEAKFSCSHGEDMLAYLYDELPPYGRERFEAHLESCTECIDEFAELAVSRYSVFEWRSIEFAPLPTPRFAVPVESRSAAASWFDGLRAAFAWNGWALSGGAAVVMLFALVGIALWNVQPDTNIAASDPEQNDVNRPANVTKPQSVRKMAEPERAAVEPEVERPEDAEPVRRVTTQRKQSTAARHVTVRRASANRIETPRASANQRLENSPTLGQYVEDEDESLRLSDIFDDLDSRDLE